MRRARGALTRAARPWIVLTTLAVVQWLLVLRFALEGVTRNGWMFFQGGDQTWYYTSAWLLADGLLAPSYVGYAWSMLLAPVAAVAGPNVVDALPAIALLQAGLLLPLALLCVYALAARLGGRILGYWAAGLWVIAPFAAMPLFDERYHDKYVIQFLPQAFGLTGLADFPSMVALLVSAYFVARTLETRSWADAAAAGLAAGLAIGLKPANAVFVPAALLALAAARHWRAAASVGAATLPFLVTLAVWKQKGLGYIPALTAPEVRIAADSALAMVPIDVERYVPRDWSQLAANQAGLREFFWSVRLLEWTAVAGAIAVARRSVPLSLLLGGWLAAFVLVKGASPQADVATGTFFRLVMPAFPAFLLLAAAVPLLVPGLGARLAALPGPPLARARRRPVVLALVVAGVVPLLVVAAARPVADDRTAIDLTANAFVPVDRFGLVAEREPEGMFLRWREHATPANVFYRVFRSGAGEDLACTREGAAAAQCIFAMELLTYVRGARVGIDPPEGRSAYRVGLVASWNDDENQDDVLVLSEPLVVERAPGSDEITVHR